jgi:hypothetical protein
MFAAIISTIFDAASPEIEELTLGIAAFEPMEALVHRFQGFGGHCTHCKALSGNVAGGDHGAFELWMPHFFEGGAKWNCEFATVLLDRYEASVCTARIMSHAL